MLGNYQTILDTFAEKTILVIGDVMLDEYHWCSVSRISPEAPVPVCTVKETTLVPGGAANVANNLVTLGCNTHLIGIIGEDSSGNKLKTLLNASGINTQGLIQNKEKPTILKSRIVAGQQHVVRVDREDASVIQRSMQNQVINYVTKHIQNADAILLSDYKKGTLAAPLLKKVIQLAKQYQLPVVVDPKGDDYSPYKGATILTPNFLEFTTVCKKDMKDEKTISNEARKLIKRLALESLLVTRSEKGMSLIHNGDDKIDIPTQAKEVFDITGAGDTVISVLTAALASNASKEIAAKLANLAAGVVVAKIGTSTVTPEEIRAVLPSLSLQA